MKNDQNQQTWLKIRTAAILDLINYFTWNLQWAFMANRKIKENGNLYHIVIIMTSTASFQWNRKRKICFHAFGQCFRMLLDTILQKPEKRLEELSLSFLQLEKELEKSYWFVFYSLLFRQIVKKLFILIGPHCNISAYTQDYELKFTIQAKFDTLISNLNSYVQYKVIMTS